MLIFVLLISTTAIALLIAILIGKRWSSWSIPLWFVILLILLSVLSIIFIIQQTDEISAGFSRQNWPSTNAEIVETNITGESAYSPEITCQYKIDGKEYVLKTDMKTPGFGRKKSRQQTSRIIIREYSVGSEVTVFYNPNDPQESFIRTGPYWNNYLILATGMIFLCLGIIVSLGSLIKLKQG